MTHLALSDRLARCKVLRLAALLAAMLVLATACTKPQPAPEPIVPDSRPDTVRLLSVPLASPLPGLAVAESTEADQLRADVDALLAESELATGEMGLIIVDLEGQGGRDEILYALNAHDPLIPASNMKIYTTATALNLLSPDYRYRTDVYARGIVDGGVLQGDLVVVGSGDPTMSVTLDQENGHPFDAWITSLKDRGIRTISGDVVGDESLFDRFSWYSGWPLDDESYWYAAQTGALSLNQNCVGVVVRPGAKVGSDVEVELRPDTCYVALDNTARTGQNRRPKKGFTVLRVNGSNTIEIKGDLYRKIREKKVWVTIDDPGAYFMTVLAEALLDGGITLSGKLKLKRDQEPRLNTRDMTLLFSRTSPRLSSLVRDTNKESNNFYAEQLFKTMGALVHGKGDRKNGADVVTRWVQSLGVSPNELRIYDGSGLSRLNRVSPFATMAILRHMYQSPLYGVFFDSLAVGGVDGTLDRRMKDSQALGNVHAKSGYLKKVSTLSGYVRGADGKLYAFSMMFNNYGLSSSKIKELQDAICGLLARYSGP